MDIHPYQTHLPTKQTKKRKMNKNLNGQSPYQTHLPNKHKLKSKYKIEDWLEDHTCTHSGARSRSSWIPPLFRGWEQHDGTQAQSEHLHRIQTRTNLGLDKRRIDNCSWRHVESIKNDWLQTKKTDLYMQIRFKY